MLRYKSYAAAAAIHLLSCIIPVVRSVPYSEYIHAPSQRDLAPISVHRVNGTVSNAAGITTTGNGTAVFSGVSGVTYDYSKNIAGLVSFVVDGVSGGDQFIGLSYTESSLWISSNSSDSTQDWGLDEVLWFKITGPGRYAVDDDHDRGGFRYLNVYHNSTGNVSLSNVTTHFTAMPHYADDALANYTGYFHSNDEKLNRVWYAGAYTNQLCTIPSNHGNSLMPIDYEGLLQNFNPRWWSNSTITNGTSALVDGARRDKLIWSGDLGISVPAIFLSTNDAITIKWTLEQIFAGQNATGQLPYSPAPLVAYPPTRYAFDETWSFTYHLYTILGLRNYYIYSNDIDYLRANWHRVELALNYSIGTIDQTDLANVTSSADWLRQGMGGHNIEYPIRAALVSAGLAARWGLYGAPAPEAGPTISPFASGWKLQAHFLAGQPGRATRLMRSMWADFMLDDARMTDSSFVEGYGVDGSLHYPAYANDARLSHAHGWSTGPVFALTSLLAGVEVVGAEGWVFRPQTGDLTSVEAGFEVARGRYSVDFKSDGRGAKRYRFSTPEGTSGSLVLDLAGCDADVKVQQMGKGKGFEGYRWNTGIHERRTVGHGAWSRKGGIVTLEGLKGGDYVVDMTCG